MACSKYQILLGLLSWVCPPKGSHCPMHNPGPARWPRSGYWAGRTGAELGLDSWGVLVDAHVVPDVKTRAIKGKERGLRHSLESSICTFALSSANGRSRPVGRKGVRGSPQMCRLINLILIEHLNMAALWWSVSCKPTSQVSGRTNQRPVHLQWEPKLPAWLGCFSQLIKYLFPIGNSIWKTWF